MRLADVAVEVEGRGNAGFVALVLPALGEVGRREAEDDAKAPAVLRQPRALRRIRLELLVVELGVVALVHVHAEGHAGVIVAVAGIVDFLLGFLNEGIAGVAGGELFHLLVEQLLLPLHRAIALHDDIILQPRLVLGRGERLPQRVIGGLEHLHAVVLHLNLEVAGRADAHQTLGGEVRRQRMPGIDQQQPAIDEGGAVECDGAGIFKAGVAFILDAPEGIVQGLFPGRQVRGGNHAGAGRERGALLGAPLVHHGVELQLGLGVFVLDAVARGDVIAGNRQRAQIERADAHRHHRRQDAGGSEERLVGIALHLMDLLVGVDSHAMIPPFRAIPANVR